MKICIFDTETSGFPKRNNNLTYEDTQPYSACRMMQIAMICLDTNNVDNDYFRYSSYILHPDPYDVNPGALNAHRITREYAQSVGQPVHNVLNLIDDVFHSVNVLVGHNVQFDIDVLRMEAIRYDHSQLKETLQDPSWFCTMTDMEHHCKLPKAAKHHTGSYKWPTLEQAYSYIKHGHCNMPFGNDSHDAFFDLKATSDIFLWLLSRPQAEKV